MVVATWDLLNPRHVSSEDLLPQALRGHEFAEGWECVTACCWCERVLVRNE